MPGCQGSHRLCQALPRCPTTGAGCLSSNIKYVVNQPTAKSFPVLTCCNFVSPVPVQWHNHGYRRISSVQEEKCQLAFLSREVRSHVTHILCTHKDRSGYSRREALLYNEPSPPLSKGTPRHIVKRKGTFLRALVSTHVTLLKQTHKPG